MDLAQLPLNALRAFEAAARHESFTRAGLELRITQAAVSHHVKALEDILGVPLFRRLPRGLALSEEGEALLPVLTEALRRIEIVVMAMIETKEGIANLDVICATPGLDAVYIGPADLSFALGLAPRGDNPDPSHLATCDKILAAAHKHGIKGVMHCASAAFAAGAVKHGFDMVMLTLDLSCMIAGARMQLDELKSKTA
jgi:2-keto-3-deoxy-L-rhamnonate aldolase RhmA